MKGEELTEKETPKETVEFVLEQNLQIKLEVEDALWIKKKKGGSILIAKLKSWEDKRAIMVKKNKLKGKKLYIENDLTLAEREVQKNY